MENTIRDTLKSTKETHYIVLGHSGKKFMNYCDLTESISEWQSEILDSYRSPIDNRVHRYFLSFLSIKIVLVKKDQ